MIYLVKLTQRNKIIKFLEKDIQSIITTTDINDINEKILENATIYSVKNRKVTKKGKMGNGRKNGKL